MANLPIFNDFLNVCGNCGAPTYGNTPLLTIGITDLDGHYCSVECCNKKVNIYFGENGHARQQGCSEETARKIIDGIAKQLDADSSLQKRSIDSILKDIKSSAVVLH